MKYFAYSALPLAISCMAMLFWYLFFIIEAPFPSMGPEHWGALEGESKVDAMLAYIGLLSVAAANAVITCLALIGSVVAFKKGSGIVEKFETAFGRALALSALTALFAVFVVINLVAVTCAC